MSESRKSRPAGASEVWERHELILDRFEAAWLRGECPAIDDFLPPDEPDRLALLTELAQSDLECRLRAELPAGVEDYLQRYPELAADSAAVMALVRVERDGRVRRGGALETEEIERRFGRYLSPDEVAAGLGTTHRPGGAATGDGRATLLDGRQPDPTGPHPLPAVPGFELLGVLGRGGMGVVYKARQLKVNRVVALKMLLAGAHAGRDEQARFRREAEAIARLQHPHIVQVFEVGEHDGLPYFSLEFCGGGSLERKLASTPLPPQEAAALVELLARAMQVAHQKGIVHRDLKPANVLLAEDGTPKITDFGLAKQLGGDKGQTRSDAILGTPSYMAPEQTGGRTGEIGPASDVYALGAILYELLTGRPPFKGPTPLETFLQVNHIEPVAPRALQPRTPPDLERICLRCLDKEPGRRYASALDLADDLGRFQRREPVLARPIGRLARGGRWCRRNPTVAALLALVFVILVAGASGSSVFALLAGRRAREAEEEKRRAEVQAQNARTSADEARRRADDEQKLVQSFKTLLLAFRESEPLYFLGGYGTAGTATAESNPFVRTLTARFPELLRDPPTDPAFRADLLDTIGDFYRNYGYFEKAEPLLKEAIELRKPLGEERPEYAASLHSLAWLRHDQGNYAAGEDLYRQALALRERHGDAEGLDATRFSLARLLLEMGDYGQAEELLHALLEDRRARYGDLSRHVAVVKLGFAGLYIDRGEPEKALKWDKEAIDTFIGLDGDRGPWRAVSLFQQAMIASELPLLPWDPVAKFKESLDLIGRSLGETHPYNALVLHELARHLEKKKDDKGAEKYYRQCLDVAEASGIGFGHPRVGIAVSSLAGLLGRTGRAAEGDRLFEKLLDAHRKRFGPDHFLVADALTEQAIVLHNRNDLAGEARALGDAVAIYRKGDRLRGRLCATALNNLAIVFVRQKRYPDAQELLEMALGQARKQYGERQGNVGQTLVNLASVKLAQGDTRGVEDHLREAEACLPPLSFNRSPLLNYLLAYYGWLYRLTNSLPEAEAAALRRRRAFSGDPQVLYLTACDLGLLVPIAGESAARGRYADLAVETLGQAVKHGWKDASQLLKEPALAELQSRDDFKKLVSELGAK
jgi:tetratricopeptide (TPR) repeat protein/tRNA A-37 threonylcarbamoyl transferase component Bud32